MSYDLEFDKAVKAVRDASPERVLIQLAEGLRPQATALVDALEEKFPGVEFVLWAGSCFGSCDVPRTDDFDLLLAFGHSAWPFWS